MARVSLKNIHKLMQTSQNQLPIPSSFLQELNMTIEKGNESRTPSKTYKPSSLYCHRQMVYQVQGVAPDASVFDASGIGIVQSGSDRHERIQKAVADMKNHGYDCEYLDVGDFVEQTKPVGTRVVSKMGMETKLFNDVYKLSFMADGLVKYKGELYILEIKTEASFKFNKRQEPEPQHIVQATCYALALGVNKVLFVYESRDVCNKKCYLVNVSEDMMFNKVIEPIELCDQYIREGKVPPKTANEADCKWCNYKETCRRDG